MTGIWNIEGSSAKKVKRALRNIDIADKRSILYLQRWDTVLKEETVIFMRGHGCGCLNEEKWQCYWDAKTCLQSVPPEWLCCHMPEGGAGEAASATEYYPLQEPGIEENWMYFWNHVLRKLYTVQKPTRRSTLHSGRKATSSYRVFLAPSSDSEGRTC